MNGKSYDSTADTRQHIERVQSLLFQMIGNLHTRRREHDMSKFMSPEKEVFDRETPNLKSLEYGSDEYKQALGRMKVALDHHYANNSHHPEHYENGMAGMSLLDLMEMLADWKAATERHETGDITKSIDLNAERFGYDEMMRSIFHNTISEMGWEAVDDRFARSMTSGFSRRVWDGDFNPSPEPEYNKAVRDHVRSDYLNDADLVIAHLWREAYERVRRILLSRGVSDYLDEVFMEPEYWDSEHDDFSGKLVHYLNMEKVMSVLVTNWLGDEEIKDFDDE
jgi:hypothetical protein